MCMQVCRCMCSRRCVCARTNFIRCYSSFHRYRSSTCFRVDGKPLRSFLAVPHTYTPSASRSGRQKLLTGEEIVEESVVVFSMQFSYECLHHSLPKKMLYCVAFFPSVNLELLEIPIVVIRKYPTPLSHT